MTLSRPVLSENPEFLHSQVKQSLPVIRKDRWQIIGLKGNYFFTYFQISLDWTFNLKKMKVIKYLFWFYSGQLIFVDDLKKIKFDNEAKPEEIIKLDISNYL